MTFTQIYSGIIAIHEDGVFKHSKYTTLNYFLSETNEDRQCFVLVV